MAEATFDARTILGFDPFDPAFRSDPYTHYRRLRDGDPLQRTPAGIWVSPSHKVCADVLRDARFGHGNTARPQAGGDRPLDSFIHLDPPDHTRLRRLVSKAFSARIVERLRPRLQRIVDSLIDRAFENETVDLIDALAYPLPVIMISELLGVPPEDDGRFRRWSAAFARGLDPDFILPPAKIRERNQGLVEFDNYFRDLVARRRAEPADDLLTALVQVEERDEVLSEGELLATCRLLLIAGHETTVNLIGNGALALLRNPDQLAHFRDNLDEAPAAVEELLRYDPPAQMVVRTALEDADVAGTRIRRGEDAMLLLGAANRDPEVFTDPDRLDLTRAPERHLAFGLGIHFCLGALLARLEGEIALRTLIQRAPNLTMASDTLSYKDNLVLRGLVALPVRLR